MAADNQLITVLTATYNRGDLLVRLYESLVSQEVRNFVWVVIDDGSSDNTRSVVGAFLMENLIPIKYLYKENGGKHRALTEAMKIIDTELTFIVDSDDYLTKDACKRIEYFHDKYRANSNLCGYSFLKKFPNGMINNIEFPENELIESYIQCRVNRGIGGDKAEVYFSKILQQYPFPEFKDEKFMNEDVIWIKIGQKYKMVHINEAIYICEYLEDGLTKKGKILKIKNPLGGIERGKAMMCKECKASVRLKGALYYVVFSKFAKKNLVEILNHSQYKYLTGFCYIAGYIIYQFYKRKYAL